MNVWRLSWRVSQHEPRTFWLGWSTFVVFFSLPALIGWVLSRGFAALERGDTTAVYRAALALVALEVARMAVVHVAALAWTRVWVHMQSILRANLLIAQLSSGGTEQGPPVASAGEALTHFRDDTEDVAMFIDGMVDVSGGLVFTVIAGFVLGAADLGAAAVLLIPLLAIAVATRALDTRIKAYRAADREAAGDVTGFVGEVVSSATTVRVNDAAESVLARLRTLVDRRRVTAVRDRVLDEGVQAFSQGAADVGLALVILVSAGAISTGAFGVGTLALFAAYLGWLSFLPRMVGRMLARRKQATVAFERMARLVPGGATEALVHERTLPIGRRATRVRPPVVRPERVRLERLEVRGLGVVHRDAVDGALAGVDLVIERGSITIVTGPIGAGKSTLLRAILGLLDGTGATVTGELRWNGVPVLDRAAFLVPPNAAFASQVPHLVSDSLAENVALGPAEPERIERALRMAAIAEDVAAFPEGTATTIGPRGLRLSGGQRQRLATARALVHAPELVVLDDVSSALDVETELRLWDELAAVGATVLAVSHREVAFDRADQVVHLEAGRVVGVSRRVGASPTR
jgi:ATP-binding cassette subfamily B protein